MPVQYLLPKADHESTTSARSGHKNNITEKPIKPRHVHADDYEAKYSGGDYLEEAGSDARVWRVYVDEKRAEDESLLKVWRETVDVLLVFAALFSAVVTTFVIESSQALQQDYTFVTASLLTELVAIQRAQASGGQVASVPHSIVNVSSPFSADPLGAWINGLWFTSLSLSLSVVLFSVLIKQWLLQYPSPLSYSPHEQVMVRQFRYTGLWDWQVSTIVGSLPVLLHISLLIFLTGLVLFLRPLNVVLSWIILVLTGLSYFIYFVTPLIPLKYPQCPYKSPLTEVAGKGAKFVFSMLFLIFERAALYSKYLPCFRFDKKEKYRKLKHRLRAIRNNLQGKLDISVQTQEGLAIQKAGKLLSAQALETICSTSPNLSLRNDALEAYSVFVDELDDDIHHDILRNGKLLPDLEDAFLSCFTFGDHSNVRIVEGRERKAERLSRAMVRLQYGTYSQRVYDSRHVSCWKFLQEYGEHPQYMILELLARSAVIYYREGYGYDTLEVKDEAFIDVCHQRIDRQLPSWVWNQLQKQLISRDLRGCFATESDLFEVMKSLISKLPPENETSHSKYTILVLHSFGCPLRGHCPELNPENRTSSVLLFHALVGVLEQCDHDTSMVFYQHLYEMIVIDLGWFDGRDDVYEEMESYSTRMDVNTVFRSYQECLLAKLEADLEIQMLRRDDPSLKGLSYNGVLIIPELCFELHSRIYAEVWNKSLMLKALRCLEVGWELTRSMAQFLVNCFDSGLLLNVVEIFEEYNGLNMLLPYLNPTRTADARAWANTVLIHYYTTVAQKSPVDARRIFEHDFEDLRRNEVFPEVVEGVFQLLQSTWFTISERLTALLRRNVPDRYPYINSESFYPSDLIDNFKMILNLYEECNEQYLWRYVIKCISKINMSNPPPFELRNQFISTFEAIEDLKIKVQAQGRGYDLYFSMPGGQGPVDLGKDHILGPCIVRYTSGILTHNTVAPISAPSASDSQAEEEGTLFVRLANVARRFPGNIRNLVNHRNRPPGNRPPV